MESINNEIVFTKTQSLLVSNEDYFIGFILYFHQKAHNVCLSLILSYKLPLILVS